jgi:hypothetical protein
MTHPHMQILLGAVRRRLWRAQFAAALRLALWASAGSMLLAAAVQALARPVPLGALLLALAVPWATLLSRAGWRRPTNSACALWADRHLGGASAFSTLLESDDAPKASISVHAVRHLAQWVAAKVPESVRLLAGRQESMHLSRPLLSMLICAALSAFVLTLPAPGPSSRPQGAKSPASSTHDMADRPMAGTEASATAGLVGEITSALRSTASREGQERRGGGAAPAAGSGRTDESNERSAAQEAATPAGKQATASHSSPGTATAAIPEAGTAQAPGTGSGRDAGDAQDDRTHGGVSRAAQGTIPVQQSDAGNRRVSNQRQADMSRSASYDEEPTAPRTAAMLADHALAAATPPSATETPRLTRTEHSYMQAWMKASERSR